MAVKSQLSVPLSQNTAPVFKFDCLYTHDLVRKQKRWQDGILAFHTFNKRVMVYDLTNNFIGDTHWRESEFVQVGDDLRLDRGVLVEVGEAKGRKEQDISEIFAKKNGTAREPSSPIVPVRLSGQKPRSISAVLEASKKGVYRPTRAPLPSIIPDGSSPYDFDTQRSPKRRKLANETPPRQALAEKTVQNRAVVRPTANRMQPEAVSTRTKEPPPKFSMSRMEPQTKPSKATKNSEPVQPRTKQSEKIGDDLNSRVQKPKKQKQTENPGAPKPAKANKTSTAKAQEPVKNGRERPRQSKNPATTTPIDSSAIDLTNSERPKSKLLASKTRRKKLIFKDLLPVEKDPIPIKPLPTKKTSKAAARRTYLVDEEFQDYIVRKSPPRDVIVISSPVKDWAEFEISEDGEGEISNTTRKSFTKMKANIDVRTEPRIAEHAEVESNTQPISDVDTIHKGPIAAVEESVDDIGDFTELINDENLLASLVDDSIQPEIQDNAIIDGEGESFRAQLVTDNRAAEDPHPLLEETKTPTESPSITAAALDVLPTDILLPDSAVNLNVELPAAAAAAEVARKENETRSDTTTIPTATNQESHLSRADSTAVRPTTSTAEETLNTVVPQKPQPHPEPPVPAAEGKEPEPIEQPIAPILDIPPPQPTTIKPLAPLATLLRTANPILPMLIAQKPLPQFRPPQQTTTAGRPRRSPLRKSLSTSADGQAVSTGESTIASLARTGSDGVIANVVYTEADYDSMGPWSREAFDLFGWTPDAPKGRVLGPVAARACGCRAAAAATSKA